MFIVYIVGMVGALLLVSSLTQLSIHWLEQIYDKESVIRTNHALYKLSVWSFYVLAFIAGLITLGGVLCIIE